MSGTLSLEAIRWLGDVGAALVCIDRDGEILRSSGPTKSEAKLRRAQALAPHTGAGLEITRALLSQKLAGQQQLFARQLVAPVGEQVASMLVKTEPKLERLPTPLTEANRRSDRARRRGSIEPSTPTNSTVPRPERRCKRCRGELPKANRGRRTYCDACLPHYQRDRYEAFIRAGRASFAQRREQDIDPAHGGEATARRAASQTRRRRELLEWQAVHPESVADPDWFRREILPAIQSVSLSDLVRATGLTHPYLSQIRRGVKTPYPRHWPAFAAFREQSALGADVATCCRSRGWVASERVRGRSVDG
jgi:hypothetical protein